MSFVFLILWKRLVPAIPGALPITIIGIAIGYVSAKGWIPYIDRIDSKFPSLTFELFIPSELFRVLELKSIHEHLILIKAI